VVTLHYKLKKDNGEGALIEETYNAQPLQFIYGVGSMIPKFETELAGLKANDSFAFGVPAAEAYGEMDENAIIDLSVDIFKIDGALDTNAIFEGAMVPMRNAEGHRIDGKVVSIGEEQIKMDFNHPLAGQNLFFEGEVVELRDATEEEIQHGHIHQAGGCGSGSCDSHGEGHGHNHNEDHECGCGSGCGCN
jgi:FKBP-type peptidyl-prolyl cis-trans isomerase SlyD